MSMILTAVLGAVDKRRSQGIMSASAEQREALFAEQFPNARRRTGSVRVIDCACAH
jgi:hypothetical protein